MHREINKYKVTIKHSVLNSYNYKRQIFSFFFLISLTHDDLFIYSNIQTISSFLQFIYSFILLFVLV